MGLWPGDDYFGNRYDYAAEYVQVMRELFAKGRSDFKGSFYKMEDCVSSPQPDRARGHRLRRAVRPRDAVGRRATATTTSSSRPA